MNKNKIGKLKISKLKISKLKIGKLKIGKLKISKLKIGKLKIGKLKKNKLKKNNTLKGEITSEIKKNDSRLLAAEILMQIIYCQRLNQDHGITTLNLITDLSSPIKYRYDRSYIVSPKELETIHRGGKELLPDLNNRIGVQIQQLLAAYAMDFLHHNQDEELMEIDEFLSSRLSDYGERIPLLIEYLTVLTDKKDDENLWDWIDSVHIPALVYYFKETLENIKKYHRLILKIADQIFEKVKFNQTETLNLIKWIEEHM